MIKLFIWLLVNIFVEKKTLVPGSPVEISAQEKPERLLRALLMTTFTEEELAAGCAMGKRQAHNKKGSMVGVPLNPVILGDIKRKLFFI